MIGPAARRARGSPSLPILVDAVLDTIAGEASSVAIHPGRAAALAEGTDIKGFTPNGLFFLEADRLQRGLLLGAGLGIRSQARTPPYEGMTLPSGHMHDDVQYFAPGPDFPWANTQAATQRARTEAMGIELGAGRPAPAPGPGPSCGPAAGRPGRFCSDAGTVHQASDPNALRSIPSACYRHCSSPRPGLSTLGVALCLIPTSRKPG